MKKHSKISHFSFLGGTFQGQKKGFKDFFRDHQDWGNFFFPGPLNISQHCRDGQAYRRDVGYQQEDGNLSPTPKNMCLTVFQKLRKCMTGHEKLEIQTGDVK